MRSSNVLATTSTSCQVEGCERTAEIKSRVLCRKHYQRWKAHGDPTVALRDRDHSPTCLTAGCDRPVRSRGLCDSHYRRQFPPDPQRPILDEVRERRIRFFWANLDRESAAPCWLWTRKPTAKGYGQMRGYRGPIASHRFAYELLVGPVPDGLELDHLCKVRACCNPDHLEPVTRQVNLERSDRSRPGNGGRRSSAGRLPPSR